MATAGWRAPRKRSDILGMVECVNGVPLVCKDSVASCLETLLFSGASFVLTRVTDGDVGSWHEIDAICLQPPAYLGQTGPIVVLIVGGVTSDHYMLASFIGEGHWICNSVLSFFIPFPWLSRDQRKKE